MYDPSRITSEVCIRCGACCSAYVRKGTTELVLLEEVTSTDEVEVIACPHLLIQDDLYLCMNYERRPDVCRQYNCMSKPNLGPVLLDRVRRSIELTLVT